MVTNARSGTNVHEIAPDIYRINTPVAIAGGPMFNFNQYLVADDDAHPTTLACMHGSAWRGDGSTLLRALATALQ